MNFEISTLFASLIWGSVGTGFAIYGKKQSKMGALIAGLVMIAVSYFVESALLMSAICVALIAGTIWLKDRF